MLRRSAERPVPAVAEVQPRSESPYAAILLVDEARNILFATSCSQEGPRMLRLLCADTTRLRPDVDPVAIELIERAKAEPSNDNICARLDAQHTIRVSSSSPADEACYALVVENDRNADNLSRAASRYGLTRRQTEVLVLVLEGQSAGEIARTLCISEYTAQGYIKTLLSKTTSRNRPSMVARVLDWATPRRKVRQFEANPVQLS